MERCKREIRRLLFYIGEPRSDPKSCGILPRRNETKFLSLCLSLDEKITWYTLTRNEKFTTTACLSDTFFPMALVGHVSGINNVFFRTASHTKADPVVGCFCPVTSFVWNDTWVEEVTQGSLRPGISLRRDVTKYIFFSSDRDTG